MTLIRAFTNTPDVLTVGKIPLVSRILHEFLDYILVGAEYPVFEPWGVMHIYRGRIIRINNSKGLSSNSLSKLYEDNKKPITLL